MRARHGTKAFEKIQLRMTARAVRLRHLAIGALGAGFKRAQLLLRLQAKLYYGERG